MNEKLIQKYTEKWGCTRQEAIELIEYDNKVEKNLPTEHDLSDEKAKIAKKYTILGEKTVKKAENAPKTAKNRAKDLEKSEIITKIFELVGEFADYSAIINTEREISFTIGDNSYGLTLTKHRKRK